MSLGSQKNVGAVSLFLFIAGFIPFTSEAMAPREQVEAVVNKSQKVLSNFSLDNRQKLEGLRKVVLPVVDVDGMAQSVLATHWKKYNESERRELVDAFQKFFEEKFTERLQRLEGARVIYQGDKKENNYAAVQTVISTADGRETQVIFKLRTKEGEWKIYDLIVWSRSFVNHYRTMVNNFLHIQPFDKLLRSLKDGTFEVRVVEKVESQ